MLSYVNPDIKADSLNKRTVSRIEGRKAGPGSTPRPIKVVLETQENKERTMRNLRHIKEKDSLRHIGIAHDRTRKEIEQDRKLKSELDETKKQSGEHLIIDRGRETRQRR